MRSTLSKLTTLLAVSLTSATLYAQSPEKPNIILVVTDDQHRIDFNYLKEGRDENGKALNLTPNIDRLSSEGIIFDQMYATSTVCTPSRFSVLTGNLASRATNSRFTKDLKLHTKMADILVVCAGVRDLITKKDIKEDAIVIDVGIHRKDDGKLCGDVNFDTVSEVAKMITPVPGGVGPMTIAALLANTVQAYQLQQD